MTDFDTKAAALLAQLADIDRRLTALERRLAVKQQPRPRPRPAPVVRPRVVRRL